MSRLAHFLPCPRAFAPRAEWFAERRAYDARIQAEVREARSIQQQTGCSWSEALQLAYKGGR